MRIAVRVPATSANLGPGFDSFGMALELCNEVRIDTDEAPEISWEGEGALELPTDGSDMVSATMRMVGVSMELALPPFSLHGVNRIPLARGLGSSSAAAVAGVVLASRLLELGVERDPASVTVLATEVEGHPDNAAPAAYGGVTIATSGGFVHRIEPHPDLRPVAIVPDVAVATSDARAALPETVPFGDAVFNATHAALMVEALRTDPELLRVALQDRLHERVRMDLVPGLSEVADEARRHNIPLCVSGAGPTLLAFPLPGGSEPSHELLDLPSGWRIWPLEVRRRGFEVMDEG
jgi:homoserine kinase